MRGVPILLALVLAWPLPSPGSGQAVASSRPQMIQIPAGSYLPHFSRDNQRVEVSRFELDRYPVSQFDFAEFLRARPEWGRGAIKPVFADAGYLRSWQGSQELGGEGSNAVPVTEVSWFAAKAYCDWRGARLPTLDEWEYVGSASETRRDAVGDPAFIEKVLELSTARTATPRVIGAGFRNAYGINDMHGVVWEWVLDFNHLSVPDDSRSSPHNDVQLYCAAAGVRATDPSNYPAFLRYAMRGGLEARSTVGNVGFRCARSS